jgi:hypothetical protein
MPHCIALAVGLFCSSAPPLTPAQAADILRPYAFYMCTDCNGPTVSSTAFVPAPPITPRRLDGTLLSTPPTVIRMGPWRTRPRR